MNKKWYVLQTNTGRENTTKTEIERRVSTTACEKVFIPQYESKRKFHGQWETVRQNLFPGYVFLISDNTDLLFQELKKVDGYTKLIGTGKEIVPLTQEEIDWIKKLGGDDYLVEMSIGVIEKSQTRILSGPLMGMEGTIVKIDRHKRKAWIKCEMFGRNTPIEIGLEVISKTI